MGFIQYLFSFPTESTERKRNTDNGSSGEVVKCEVGECGTSQDGDRYNIIKVKYSIFPMHILNGQATPSEGESKMGTEPN